MEVYIEKRMKLGGKAKAWIHLTEFIKIKSGKSVDRHLYRSQNATSYLRGY
jgi:hypothetical protein